MKAAAAAASGHRSSAAACCSAVTSLLLPFPCLPRLAGIPFEEVRINLGKVEQRGAEFRAVNPLGKVPALQASGLDCVGTGCVQPEGSEPQ